jgi:hypothetical protein
MALDAATAAAAARGKGSFTPGDPEGLVCAFDLAPVAPRGGDVLSAAGAPAVPQWLHFNLADGRSCSCCAGATCCEPRQPARRTIVRCFADAIE